MKFFVFVGTIASIVITSLLRGLVFQKLWTWFIIPLFHLPAISIPQSLGLMLVVGMFANSSTKEHKETSYLEAFLKATLSSLTMSALYIVLGLIVKAFI